jgi:hypothetical protein
MHMERKIMFKEVVKCVLLDVLVANCKKKGKPVPLHAMEALGGRGGIAPTHSRPRH